MSHGFSPSSSGASGDNSMANGGLYELGLWIESHGDLEFYSTTLISGTIAAVLGTKIYCLQTPALPSTVRFNFSLISIRDMIASYIMKCHTTSTM